MTEQREIEQVVRIANRGANRWKLVANTIPVQTPGYLCRGLWSAELWTFLGPLIVDIALEKDRG